MNTDRLLAYYEEIAEAPDAIPQLRRFILDLAVRGKLVAQDPDDEPASVLLKRMADERILPKSAKESKKQYKKLAIQDINTPFELPWSWDWTSLGEVAQYGSPDKFTSSDNISKDTWVLDLEDIEKDTSKLIQRFSYAERPFQSAKTAFKKGDVLFCKLRPYLNKVLIADTDGVCTSEIIPIRGLCQLPAEYIRLVLKSPLTMNQVARLMYGMKMPRLGTGDAISLAFPLPPLAEQKRIVAKVDELMALCDQLEAARTKRETTRARLTKSSLARLNEPDLENFQDNARFVLNSLPALASQPDQIKQLRQTILNLAVRGKLVPQDPKDEPASELLTRIVKKKAKAARRNKVLPTIDATEKYFEAPLNWSWVRVGDIFSIRTGFAFKSSTYAEKGTLVFRVTNFDRDGAFDLSDSAFFPTEKIDARMSTFLLEKGEIVMVMVGGTIGKTAIVSDAILPALLNQNMWRIRSFDGALSNKFEYLLIKHINQSMQGLTQSTHGHFAMGDYEKRVFALPPLAEQHRIVAKFDEIMAVCDQLEQCLKIESEHRARLLKAALASTLEVSDREAA